MSSKNQYKEYTVNLRRQVKELKAELDKTSNQLSHFAFRNAKLIQENSRLRSKLEVKELTWKVIFINKRKVKELTWKVIFINKRKVKKFLYELYKRYITSHEFFYILWDAKKDTSIKDKFEELLKL